MAAVGGDAASMVAVGLVWGATNALMRRGALVWDRRSRSLPAGTGAVRRWADLLLTWQYSAPFLANLSASAAFFRLLGDAPISVAVPVTNATTFAATAVAAALLGEATRAAPAALGTALIVLGVWAECASFSGLDRELGNGPYLNALFWSSHDTVPGYS
uniref:Transmembrane protein 234-like protein n=1 Tax=Aegilops tauschii TaxID=37682 RepID=M8BTL0_AEGTA